MMCTYHPSLPFTHTQSLRPEVTRFYTAVDKAVSNRDQYINKFCSSLDRDITELEKEVKEIKNKAQVPTCSQMLVFFACEVTTFLAY